MSGCGSLFVNLGGGGGGTVNTGVLQIAGGVALDSTLRFVEDQAGTDSPLKLSTTRASILLPDCTTDFSFSRYSATINLLNGIGFDGGTIYSFFAFNFVPGANRGSFNINGLLIGDPNTSTQNGALSVVSLGGNIASFRDSSNVQVASITGAGNITGLDFLSANLTAGSLSTARVFRIGDKGTVVTGNDLGLNAQIAVEHNGSVYYIPCSTSLIT